MTHNEIDHDTEKDEETNPLVQLTTSQLVQAALSAKLENLFGKLFYNVSFFVIFCHLFNILHAASGPSATQNKEEIRGFLKI